MKIEANRCGLANMIEANRCEIQVAHVEIRHLVLGRRNLTLSVFRQIPVGRFWGPVGGRIGVTANLWGRVNYFWPDDGRCGHWTGEKIHVLAERDGALLRDVVGTSYSRSKHYTEWTRDLVGWEEHILPTIVSLPQLFIAV